jgi:hypothetical protein
VVEEVCIDQGEVAAFIGHGVSEARNAERLAWRAADEDINLREKFFRPLAPPGHVAEVRDMGPMVGEDGRRERFDFGESERLPTHRVPRGRSGFDPGAE